MIWWRYLENKTYCKIIVLVVFDIPMVDYFDGLLVVSYYALDIPMVNYFDELLLVSCYALDIHEVDYFDGLLVVSCYALDIQKDWTALLWNLSLFSR